MRKTIRIAVFVLAVAMILFAGYKVFDILAEYREADETYESIAEEFRHPATAAPETSAPATEPPVTEPSATDVPVTSEPSTEPPETVPVTMPFSVDFEKLWRKNDDIVGWIYSEGTPIDYPIVQAADNDYYLRRMLNKRYNVAGSIFMDYRSASDLSDPLTVIYGHNMKNSKMFGTLTEYGKEGYYNAHPSLWILTPAGGFRIDIVAGFDLGPNDAIYQYPNSEEEMSSWLDVLADHPSDFTSCETIGEGDRVIMLSTCSYAFDNARYVLVGKLVPAEQN